MLKKNISLNFCKKHNKNCIFLEINFGKNYIFLEITAQNIKFCTKNYKKIPINKNQELQTNIPRL